MKEGLIPLEHEISHARVYQILSDYETKETSS